MGADSRAPGLFFNTDAIMFEGTVSALPLARRARLLGYVLSSVGLRTPLLSGGSRSLRPADRLSMDANQLPIGLTAECLASPGNLVFFLEDLVLVPVVTAVSSTARDPYEDQSLLHHTVTGLPCYDASVADVDAFLAAVALPPADPVALSAAMVRVFALAKEAGVDPAPALNEILSGAALGASRATYSLTTLVHHVFIKSRFRCAELAEILAVYDLLCADTYDKCVGRDRGG